MSYFFQLFKVLFGSFPTGLREQYRRRLDLNLESLNAFLAHFPDFAKRVFLVNKVDPILRKLRAIEKKIVFLIYLSTVFYPIKIKRGMYVRSQ